MTQLLICKADSIHDDRVWFKKSHSPLSLTGSGPVPTFDCDKLLVIVRNPLDVLYSMHCFCSTQNHAIKPEFDVDKKYPEEWDFFIRQTIPCYKRWFEMVTADCKAEGMVPHYFVRYEDICCNPKETYEEIFKFLLGVDDLKGTNVERRILEVVTEGTQTYALTSSNRLNINSHRFNASQIEFVKTELAEMLYRFGYTNFEATLTSFFQFDDHTKYGAIYGEFRTSNRANLTV